MWYHKTGGQHIWNVPLVEFMYLVFTRMPGESHRRWRRSLLLCLYDVSRALINSFVFWFILNVFVVVVFLPPSVLVLVWLLREKVLHKGNLKAKIQFRLAAGLYQLPEKWAKQQWPYQKGQNEWSWTVCCVEGVVNKELKSCCSTDHSTCGWGRPLTAHSNLTGRPSRHSRSSSCRVNTGASDLPE